MSLKDIKKRQQKSTFDDEPRFDLKQLRTGDIIEATVKSIAWKIKNGKDALQVIMSSEKGSIIQIYSPMHLVALGEALEKLGVDSIDTDETFVFEATAFGIGYPRLIPVSVKPKK